jgi:hypothetical protein
MVVVVVAINLLIALVLLYVAWRIRQLKRRIVRITDKIIAIERSIHLSLNGAPDRIMKGQRGLYNLRQPDRPLVLKLQQLQRALTLFGLGQQIWQRAFSIWRVQLFKRSSVRYR